MYTVKIDKRGKILIPASLRKSKKIFIGQKVLIIPEKDNITISPYKYTCTDCGSEVPDGDPYGFCEECRRKRRKRVY